MGLLFAVDDGLHICNIAALALAHLFNFDRDAVRDLLLKQAQRLLPDHLRGQHTLRLIRERVVREKPDALPCKAHQLFFKRIKPLACLRADGEHGIKIIDLRPFGHAADERLLLVECVNFINDKQHRKL